LGEVVEAFWGTRFNDLDIVDAKAIAIAPNQVSHVLIPFYRNNLTLGTQQSRFYWNCPGTSTDIPQQRVRMQP
jgi:hypothetical protein